MKKTLTLLLLLALLAGGGWWYWQQKKEGEKTVYLTEPAVRDRITRQVVATGTIDAVELVT